MKKIEIKFVIELDKIIDNSEQYINKSIVLKQNKITIRESLINNISKYFLVNKVVLKTNNFDLLWTEFIKQVNKCNYKLYEVKSLRKGNKKLGNLNRGDSIENVVIIITSDNDDLIYNSLIFCVNIENPKKENSPIKVSLRRIEYDNFNFNNDKQISIKLDNYENIDYEYTHNEVENWKDILKELKSIFNNEDFDDDKLQLKEWKNILKEMKNAFNNKKEDLKDNFISLYKDKLFLFSKQEIKLNQKTYKLYDKNSGETIDDFEFSNQKILNDEFLIYLKNDIVEEKENLQKINEEIKKIELKNEKIKKDHTQLKDQLNILDNKYEKLLNDLNEYQNQIDFLNKNFEIKEEENKINIKISKIETLKNDVLKSINKIEKDINTLKVDLNNKNQKIETNNKKIQKLKNQSNMINNNISNYQELIIDLEKNYEYIYSFNATYEEKDLDIPNILNKSSKKQRNLCFENKEKGTIAKINRYYNALLNLEQGYYKNPFFFEAIKNPEDICIDEKRIIDSEILEKYHLNKKQILAVNKAINTNSICFIQGPPGTGKTQTICSITEWILKNNMNLVMTSSTHEAISNFFDRLDEYSYDNPNIILYKYKFYKKDNRRKEEYDEDTLFDKFKSKIINYVLPKESNTSKLEQLINKYQLEYDNNFPNDYKNFLPKAIVKLIFENWENEAFTKNFYTNVDEKTFCAPIYIFNSMSEQIETALDDKSNKNDQNKLFNQLIEEYIKTFKNNKFSIENFKYYFDENIFKEISNFIKKQKSHNDDKLIKLFENIKIQYQNHEGEDYEYENKFFDHIKLHKLVNVIGITTSANNKIELNGEEITLYDEYPIDYMIIDEISKCSTPEIISKAVLSKKCLFVGDYLQLPPSADLNDDVIINHLKKVNYYDNEKMTTDDIKREITNLFKNSFFVIQKDKIVNSNSSKNRPYEFLNESHRFGKEIMKLVNIIYPQKEKLLPPKNFDFKSIKYNLKINNKNLDNPAVLINLIEITDEFTKHHEIDSSLLSKIDNQGFDQTHFIKLNESSKNQNIGDGAFNQYSAFVILNIINKLIKQNINKIKEKEIAIITLTKNQKIINEYYLNNCSLFKNIKKYIKVDTIDNFQGREANIVFVDFIRGRKKYTEGGLNKPPKRDISFLSEKERINVAISRAKQKLILVGHFDYLKSLNNFSYFHEYYVELKDSNNSYLEWNGDCYE